jgi:hypothetical protein
MRSDRSKRSGFMIEASVYPRDRMTREEQMQCIVDNVDAFEKTLLAKASKIPPNWGHGNQAMGNGLPQGCLGLEDGQDTDAPAPGGKAALRPVTLKMGLLETRTIDRRRIDGPKRADSDQIIIEPGFQRFAYNGNSAPISTTWVRGMRK